jgi:hypothetical protein
MFKPTEHRGCLGSGCPKDLRRTALTGRAPFAAEYSVPISAPIRRAQRYLSFRETAAEIGSETYRTSCSRAVTAPYAGFPALGNAGDRRAKRVVVA